MCKIESTNVDGKGGEDAPAIPVPPATLAQLRRANSLLDLAADTTDPNMQFTLHVAALHLARSIPEYWYTLADNLPLDLHKSGKERDEMAKRLRAEFEVVFRTARRYRLVSDLRHWDYHWEPLLNPMAFGPNVTHGRGSPVRISTGTQAGSSVAFFGGSRLVTTGTGHRVGRSNYYQIHERRFVDSEAGEALPLGLAVRQFLEDLPRCVATIVEMPEVVAHVKAKN